MALHTFITGHYPYIYSIYLSKEVHKMLKILFIKKKNMMKITKDIPGSQHEEI
jgi:hypothetical protein